MNTQKIIDLINDPNTSAEDVAAVWVEEAKDASEPDHTNHVKQVMAVCTLPKAAWKVREVNKLIIDDPHIHGMIQAIGKHERGPCPSASTEVALSPRHLSPRTYEVLDRWSRAFETPGATEDDGDLMFALNGKVSLDNPLTRKWRVRASVGPDASPSLASLPDLASMTTWLFRNDIQYALLDPRLGGPVAAELDLHDPAPLYRGVNHDHREDKIVIHLGKRE